MPAREELSTTDLQKVADNFKGRFPVTMGTNGPVVAHIDNVRLQGVSLVGNISMLASNIPPQLQPKAE